MKRLSSRLTWWRPHKSTPAVNAAERRRQPWRQRARDAHIAAAMRDAGGDGAVLIAGAGHARRDMGVPRLLPDADVISLAFIEVRADMTSLPVLPFD
jgi:uncharacterized iron-regulated protein